MRKISTELKNHLAQEVTTLCKCWKLTLKDSTVMGFVELDEDLTIDSLVYSSVDSFTSKELEAGSDCNYGEMSLEGILNSTKIKEDNLLSGLYDGAEVEVFIVNYKDLTMGKLYLIKGFLGEVQCSEGKFSVKLNGLCEKFENTIGEVYSPNCRSCFGDGKCGLNKASYIVSGTVTSVFDGGFASDDLTQDDNYFNYGIVTFTSGNNSGLSIDVKNFREGKIYLVMNTAYVISAGDTFNIVAGCDKKIATCRDKFSNAINFRGEPHLPGVNYLYGSN